MIAPLLNDVVVTPAEEMLRLLHVLMPVRKAWVIDVQERLSLPRSVGYDWLSTDCKLASNNRATASSPTSSSATPSMIRVRDIAMARIEPLVSTPTIFEPSSRARLVAARAVELKCSENTLLKDLRRYWQGGQTLDALLPRFDKCGAQKGEVSLAGRRRADGSAPFALQPKDKEALKAACQKYMNKAYHTVTDSHQWMLERYYTYQDGNGKKFIRPEYECPSVAQLYNWLKTRYPLEYRLRARLGDKDFERDHRHKLGSIELDCHGAGHLYEIDATIADVFLVSEADRKLIVGKPTLYFITDRATRLIVGWYVGFEHACWMAAMQAVLSIAEDKAEVCHRFGVAYDPADWPAHGIQPEQYLADQGEFASRNARRVSPGLRSTVSNVPGLRPDHKPLAECTFKMIYQVISMDLPAYDPPSNQGRRRGQAYFRDATLTLKEFTSTILHAIVTHNRTMQPAMRLSLKQVADGIQPVPTQLWTHEVEERAGALARFDADTVRLELLPQEEATVTEHGVELRGARYTFRDGERAGWFVEARKKRFKVKVSLDLRLCDSVIVHDPFTRGRVYKAELVAGMKQYEGMSFAELAQHKKAIDALTEPAAQLKRQNRLEYHEHADEIHKGAKISYDEATGGRSISRKARRKDVAAARTEERRKERLATAGVPAVTHVPASVPNKPSSLPTTPAPVVSLVKVQSESSSSAPPSDRPLTLKERLTSQRKKLASNG